MKNKNITMGIVSVVLIVAAFFGGKSYGASQTATTAPTAAGSFNRTGAPAGAGRGGSGTMGQVVSMDSTSITVSTSGGGSKIILYSPTTTVAKSTQGTIKDIAVGSTITANGPANSDGSITATTIQVRPAGSSMPGTNGATPTQ